MFKPTLDIIDKADADIRRGRDGEVTDIETTELRCDCEAFVRFRSTMNEGPDFRASEPSEEVTSSTDWCRIAPRVESGLESRYDLERRSASIGRCLVQCVPLFVCCV